MTDISKRSVLTGKNKRIKLADDPSWGDLHGVTLPNGKRVPGLVLPNERTIYYAPALGKNFSNGSRQTQSYNGGFHPLGICWHSAEEDADNIEVTPWWFQQDMGPKRVASTNFYADSDGDLFQMVRVADFAYAQGCAKEYDRFMLGGGRPDWMRQWPLSYNTFLISIEQEFHAARSDEAQAIFYEGSAMWDTEAIWAGYMHYRYSIPKDISRWRTHEELCTYKSDPGPYWESLKPRLFEQAMSFCESFEQPVPASAPASELEARVAELERWRTNLESAIRS